MKPRILLQRKLLSGNHVPQPIEGQLFGTTCASKTVRSGFTRPKVVLQPIAAQRNKSITAQKTGLKPSRPTITATVTSNSNESDMVVV
jgi:hypothetical protein